MTPDGGVEEQSQNQSPAALGWSPWTSASALDPIESNAGPSDSIKMGSQPTLASCSTVWEPLCYIISLEDRKEPLLSPNSVPSSTATQLFCCLAKQQAFQYSQTLASSPSVSAIYVPGIWPQPPRHIWDCQTLLHKNTSAKRYNICLTIMPFSHK